MAEAELTEAMIAAAKAKADARVCVLGDHRCYPFPNNVDAARASVHRTPRHDMLDTGLHLAVAEEGGSATEIVDAGTGPLTAKPGPRRRSGSERTRPVRARRDL